jgi:hypothetical protein
LLLIIFLRLSLRSLLLLLNLDEKVNGLTDLLMKLSEVVEVALDLFEGKIDEHTSDLGSSLLTDKSADVLVDELTDHLLEVGVAWEHSWEKVESIHVVLVDNGIRVRKRCLRTNRANIACDILTDVDNRGILWDLSRSRSVHVVHGSGVRLLLLNVLARTSLLSLVVESTLSRSVVATTKSASVSDLSLDQEEDLLDELDGVRSLEK